MKVTVWGINYAPEPTGIAPYNTALCERLAAHGHSVRMVTSFAYYPSWKRAAADRRQLFRTDEIQSVPVHRCWHYVPRKASTLKRIVHEGTFVATSFLRELALPRPDVYVIVSPPLLLGAAAWMTGKIKGRPFVFHVQDLQPDAAAGLGMLKSGTLIRALRRLEAFAYETAARVSGITPGMIQAFQRKGVPPSKCVLFPNGVVLPELAEARRGAFRSRHGIADDAFVVLYSGNLGVKQGLDILVQAAALLRHSHVRIVICGEGAQRDHIAALVQQRGLENVIMLPLQSADAYHEMLVDADICVIAQQAGSGGFFFPSKLLTTLAWRKPVLTVAGRDSELVRALEEGRFGVNVEPERADIVAQTIERLSRDPERLRDYAAAGRSYVERFEMSRVLDRFIAELEGLVTAGTRTSPVKTPAAGWTR